MPPKLSESESKISAKSLKQWIQSPMTSSPADLAITTIPIGIIPNTVFVRNRPTLLLQINISFFTSIGQYFALRLSTHVQAYHQLTN